MCLHYFDDFLTVWRANTEECNHNLQLNKKVCDFLGVPLKLEKIKVPSEVLVFLEILLDCQARDTFAPPKVGGAEAADCGMDN